MPISKAAGAFWLVGSAAEAKLWAVLAEGQRTVAGLFPSLVKGILWQAADPCFALELKVYLPVENFPKILKYWFIQKARIIILLLPAGQKSWKTAQTDPNAGFH